MSDENKRNEIKNQRRNSASSTRGAVLNNVVVRWKWRDGGADELK
jgi:hypothetical protein